MVVVYRVPWGAKLTMLPLSEDPLLTDIPDVDGFKVLEPCVLYSKLGQGGMGAVYRGRHLNLDIDVAVKCLPRSLADQGDTFVQRFQREARLAAGIHHQNLVQVYDVSHKRGIHYLVMEFVHGETACDRVRRKGRLGIDESMRIAVGAASGLSAAHSRRIVHRDVKPDNVLIGRDGSVKVSDLGLAKAMEGEAEANLTHGVMGTPQYMAPEQWEDSAKVTPAADVWALGATIYFLLAGTDPIKAANMQQAYKLICHEPFPDIRAVRPEVPDEIAHLIERCVARSTEQRFADCTEVLAELKRFVGHDRGELISKPGETTEMGATMVSPPPPETIAKIILQLDVSRKRKKEEPRKPEPIAPTMPMREQRSFALSKRSKLAAVIMGGVALVALVLLFALRGKNEPGNQPKTIASNEPVKPLESHVTEKPFESRVPEKPAPAPAKVVADTTPMSVTFEAIPNARRGFQSKEKNFRLTAVIAGRNPSLRAKIRETGDEVMIDHRGNRAEFDLHFASDGKYTLELEGDRITGTESLSILVDSTPPRLNLNKPKGPVKRGKKIDLVLEFNEEISSAEIDSGAAEIEDNEVEATLVSPTEGESWTVKWRATDKLDNLASASFEIELEPLPPAPQPPVVKATPTPSEPKKTPSTATPPSVPDRRTSQAIAPKGCTAIGDDSLEIGGQRWAKRIEHTATKIHLVLIPRGTFVMGSSVKSDNAPAPRPVTITRDFYMSEDEVSEAEYAAGSGSAALSGESRMPAAGISWSEADKFCRSMKLFLPTEAEWEYACRGGSKDAYAFGDELDGSEAATSEEGRTRRACGKSDRNKFGLADMHGNLKEYCSDYYLEPEEYLKLLASDPLGRKGNKGRSLRGGSYQSLAKFCTSAYRQGVDEKRGQPDCGLRVVLRIP